MLSTGGDVHVAFDAMGVFCDERETAADLAAFADHAGPVCVFALHVVMIVDLAMTLGLADLTTALAVGADGVVLLEPAADVDVVDVLLDDVVAGEPGETVPVAYLVGHFRFVGQPFLAVA